MRSKTIALAFIVASLSGCAELRDDLPPPTEGALQVHPEGWIDAESASFHGDLIRSSSWDMRECQTCHGSDYDGGVSDVSCRTCHTNSVGPENCATCHGSTNPAPPRDLSENESSDLPGVGAHQVHLTGGEDVSSLQVPCSQCHIVPSSVYVSGHLDSDPPAEVIIRGGLAEADPTVSTGQPVYDYQLNTCGNVFCHGNWSLSKSSSPYPDAYADATISGDNYAPVWTGDGTQIECGTCHGLPPAGHVAATLDSCGTCHSNIVGSDGKIADMSKHINGRVDVFDTQRPF